MGDKKRVQRKFFPTRIYDYNYKVSEGYYKPQKDFMNEGNLRRAKYSPPKHQSYAERFASNPWYGNTRGLPYKDDYSALSEPLLKPSERPSRSSLLREIKDLEEQDIPLHIRANRRRRRFEEEDEQLGIRPRITRHFSQEERYRLPPRYKDIGEKLRSLDAELERLAPKRSSVTKESYDLPSGASVQKSYKSEVSHYDSSSKAPFSPRVRKISFTESHSELPPRPRARISSVGDLPDLSRSVRQSSVTDDEEITSMPYTRRADKLRDERRFRESRDITENIHNMIEKMRVTKLNPEDGYKSIKDTPSTLDFHLKEERMIPSSFVYGIRRNL